MVEKIVSFSSDSFNINISNNTFVTIIRGDKSEITLSSETQTRIDDFQISERNGELSIIEKSSSSTINFSGNNININSFSLKNFIMNGQSISISDKKVEKISPISLVIKVPYQINLNLSMSGESTIDVKSDIDTLTVNMSGETCVRLNSCKKVQQVNMSGKSFLSIMEMNNLNISASGTAHFKTDSNLSNINANVSGCAYIQINGNILNGNINASGSSKVTAHTSKNIQVNCSGVAQISI